MFFTKSVDVYGNNKDSIIKVFEIKNYDKYIYLFML